MSTYLVDTNLLLRASDPGSASHTPAVEALAKLLARGDISCITAQNLVEFWAVATRELPANGLGWSSQKTRLEVDRLSQQFQLLEETSAVLAHWLQLVTAGDVKGKQVHDARLVAVMRAHGVTHLLTFNTQDFQRYPGIVLVHPNNVP